MLLVFDLDGTLIDSRLDIAAACNAGLVAVGRATRPDEEIASYVGDGARRLIERALGGEAESATVDRALDAFVAHYLEHPVARTSWLPGAQAALDALAADHTLAIATNKRQDIAERVLEELGVAQRFAVVVGGGSGRLKPHPEPIERIRAATGPQRASASTWMIGDGPQDVGAGKAAGATTVAVAAGFHSRRALAALAPDHLLDTLNELPERVLVAVCKDREEAM